MCRGRLNGNLIIEPLALRAIQAPERPGFGARGHTTLLLFMGLHQDIIMTTDQTFDQVLPGDPAPKFDPRTGERESFAWDTLAGRYIVLCFFGSASDDVGQNVVRAVAANRTLFDDRAFTFLGVSINPDDESRKVVGDVLPGIRFAWDFDRVASTLYGAMPRHASGESLTYRRFWLVVDPTLHVLARFDFAADPSHEAVFRYLRDLPDPQRFAGFEIPAPIIVVPNVFEPGLCEHLIKLYDAGGGVESGVMRDNVGVLDGNMKRRSDFMVEEPTLKNEIDRRIWRRVTPEIRNLFGMEITHMERYLVGCYASEQGGHFAPHRDNHQTITAHRRFAVSINLNGDFEGGDVSFPEYNTRGYKAKPGWAVVFPGAALHAVGRVTRGRRYAFLPFVYDQEGARIRDENLTLLRVRSQASLATA